MALRLARRTDPDTASEGSKIGKVFFLAGSLKDSRGILFSRSKCIGNAKMMEECIWPEFDIKSSILKESANMIIKIMASAFNQSILMGRICTSRKDIVVLVGKDILDIRIGPELSTLIKVDILVFTSRTVLEKKMS